MKPKLILSLCAGAIAFTVVSKMSYDVQTAHCDILSAPFDLACKGNALIQGKGAISGAIAGAVTVTVLLYSWRGGRKVVWMTADDVPAIALACFAIYLLFSSAVDSSPESPVEEGQQKEMTLQIDGDLASLFADLKSPGVLAICAAEGNCDPTNNWEFRAIAFGHPDPGNKKWNMGFCSDQGKGGGSFEGANKACLDYLQERIPSAIREMEEAGLSPGEHIEAFVNLIDLHNQANPLVSQVFAQKYVNARAAGAGEAILVARIESFRNSSGILDASGLFGICDRSQGVPGSPYNILIKYEKLSEEWRYNCIAFDQRRRADEIWKALEGTMGG